jgi:hypothetical protein
MQNINKSFYIITSLILGLSLINLWHYIFLKQDTSIQSVVELTNINSPCFSVAWHEERLREDKSLKYSPYPEMPTADRLSFIYGEEHE